ncbi:unnamed protein product, partial [Nesidiocoris tenuis]
MTNKLNHQVNLETRTTNSKPARSSCCSDSIKRVIGSSTKKEVDDHLSRYQICPNPVVIQLPGPTDGDVSLVSQNLPTIETFPTLKERSERQGFLEKYGSIVCYHQLRMSLEDQARTTNQGHLINTSSDKTAKQ